MLWGVCKFDNDFEFEFARLNIFEFFLSRKQNYIGNNELIYLLCESSLNPKYNIVAYEVFDN